MGRGFMVEQGRGVLGASVPGGTGGPVEVAVKGTDGSKDTNDQFVFKSGDASNVVVRVDRAVSWTKLVVDVYYV